MYKNMKDDADVMLDIGDMSPDGKIPRDLLLNGKPAVKDQFKEFLFSRDLDKNNEKRPKHLQYSTRSNESSLLL